jgi:hypothetical protein
MKRNKTLSIQEGVYIRFDIPLAIERVLLYKKNNTGSVLKKRE